MKATLLHSSSMNKPSRTVWHPSDGHIAGSAVLWILTTVPHAGMKYHSVSRPPRALMSPPAASRPTVSMWCRAEKKSSTENLQNTTCVKSFTLLPQSRINSFIYTLYYLVPLAAWCLSSVGQTDARLWKPPHILWCMCDWEIIQQSGFFFKIWLIS